MHCQSEGQLYLAAKRGHTETETFRSYNTFGETKPGKMPSLGSLQRLNDETLAAGRTITVTADVDTLVVLLPLVGGVAVTGANESKTVAEAGQVQLHYKRAGESTMITNPYEEELVNYLQLCFQCRHIQPKQALTLAFDIDGEQNNLVELFTVMQNERLVAKAYIGKLDGRMEATHHLLSETNGVMAFVVQGAFEVENRLLESRDGLAPWNTATVELEALSNDAIILLLEVPL